MFLKPHHIDKENLPKEIHYLAIRKNNYLPEGWREITEKEFSCSSFFYYSPLYIEAGNTFCYSPNGTPLSQSFSATLFYLPNKTGVAIQTEYWKQKVRYYKFGCAHQYKELSSQECKNKNISHFGNCYHVYQCQICGDIKVEDSSD